MFDKYNQNLNSEMNFPTFNNTYLDAEMLYQKRSKSVIKRREEIIKKKEFEARLKIEAKYQKID